MSKQIKKRTRMKGYTYVRVDDALHHVFTYDADAVAYLLRRNFHVVDVGEDTSGNVLYLLTLEKNNHK